ncbi:MAG: hypothetical protein IPO22_08585 [Anaerolineales bacterium]|jgi:hypothetical protein|nr:hypothetical protein [Anaerolineales bacterium]
MDNDDPITVRMGTFFIVIGLGALVLFVTSDIAKQVDFDYLFLSMLMFALGWAFRRKKAPPPPAGRFEYLRKMRENAKNKKAEKDKPKDKK